MLYKPWSHWIRWRTSHNHQLQNLSNFKTTSNSCCINLGLTGPDGVQVTITSYNIYQTLKLLETHVVLTLVSLTRWRTSHNNQLQYLSNSKTARNSCCINLGLTGPDGVPVTITSYNIYQTLKLLVTHVAIFCQLSF